MAGLFEGNLLLEALDTADRALLAPYLERGHRGRGAVLFRAGEDVSHVTFPLNQTTVTLVSRMSDGRMIETATVGHEGAVGGVVSNGYLPAFSEAIVQVAGDVMRLDAERLTRAGPRPRSCATCSSATPIVCSPRCCNRWPATPCTRSRSAACAGS